MTASWVLVHSPIVGPDTWEPVAAELRARGHEVVVPELPRTVEDSYWRSHVAAIADTTVGVFPGGTRVTVVAHSGAGQLLAPLGEALPQRGVTAEAYVLADAGAPTRGGSRLEQLRTESPELADELDAVFATRRAFPDWPDELLAPLVPDDALRRALRAGIRQLPGAYWTEPIPDNPAWPEAPCGVLLFSPGYEATAVAARDTGWPVRDLEADNHFLLLADPVAVTGELVALRDALVG